MNAKRVENIFREIVGNQGSYSIEIESDVFERFTITLYYRRAAFAEREEIHHCHTDDLIKGIKYALFWKNEDLAQRTKVKS